MNTPKDYASNRYVTLEAKKKLLEGMISKYQNLMSSTDTELKISNSNSRLLETNPIYNSQDVSEKVKEAIRTRKLGEITQEDFDDSYKQALYGIPGGETSTPTNQPARRYRYLDPRFAMPGALVRVVGDKLGENVYFIGNVKNIVEKIGINNSRGQYQIVTIRGHLNRLGINGINPKDFGINPYEYGISKETKLYTQSDIWQYLQKLDEEGKISLASSDIKSFEDIIQREFYRDKMSSRPTYGKSSRPLDTSGLWENVVRAIEERK